MERTRRVAAALGLLGAACAPEPRARLAAGPRVVDGIVHFDLSGGPLGGEAVLDAGEKRLLRDCPWRYPRDPPVRGVDGELRGWLARAPRLALEARGEARLLFLEVMDGRVRGAVCSPEGASVVRGHLPDASVAETPEARLHDLVAQRRRELGPWLAEAARRLPPLPERADEAWCAALRARIDEAAGAVGDIPALSARATEVLRGEGALAPGVHAGPADPAAVARALARRHLALCP